ncbi:MAG: FAD-binding oxidoreductase [Bacteroidia bacterium]
MSKPESFNQLISGWGNYPKVATTLIPYGAKTIEQQRVYRGLGRSYADQAILENGATITTNGHNRILHFNENEAQVTVQSGISLKELIDTFVPKGFMPFVCPGTQYVTVGGSIANDIHGKGHHIDGSFINATISFTLITSAGESLVCSRKENADLFFANAGGLGLLGFIDTVTLKLRPIKSAYFKTENFVAKDFDQMLHFLDTEGLNWHYTVGWIDTLRKNTPGVLVVGKHLEVSESIPAPLKIDTKEPISIPELVPNGMLNGISIPILNKIIEFQQKKIKSTSHYKPFFFPLDALANWNTGYGSNGFFQFQFVVPLHKGHENLKLILKAIEKSGCKPFLNVIKRFGEPSGRFLSFPSMGYTLALDFAVNKKSIALCKHLGSLIAKMNGRVYLAKDALLDAETFHFMYSELDSWKRIKKEVDPKNQFTSSLSKRIGI